MLIITNWRKKSFRKTLWEKVKLLKMSNFTFFHNIFYAICILESFNGHILVVICSFFGFRTVSKWCIREWVKLYLSICTGGQQDGKVNDINFPETFNHPLWKWHFNSYFRHLNGCILEGKYFSRPHLMITDAFNAQYNQSRRRVRDEQLMSKFFVALILSQTTYFRLF